MIQWIAVAAGGALGATLRHAVNQIALQALGADFPWGTLAVNILGSFIMGVFVGAFALFWDASQTLRLFLTVGVLGGFTTFSAFSLDSVLLLQRGQLIEAVSYILGSVILSLGGLVAGMMLVRMVPA
jgi:CrcB protein